MSKRVVKAVAWIALAAFVVLCIVSVIPFGVFAESAQERAEQAEQRQEELQDEIDQNERQQSAEMEKKRAIDEEVSQVQAQIDQLDAQIAQSNEKIAQKEEELAAAEAESNQQNQAYQERVKLMVEQGPVTYLEVLLSAKSFADFLIRADVVQQVAEYDSQLLNTLKEKEQAIADIKTELEAERAGTQALLDESNQHKQTLDARLAESQQIMKDLEADQAKLKAEQEQAQRDEEAARAEIAAALRRRASSGSSSATSVYTGGTFRWPTDQTTLVTSDYSMRTHPTLGVYKQHTGIDIGASYGTDVLAGGDGTVLISGWNNAYGWMVVIDHGGGVTTLYGHNSKLLVSAGEQVSRGQVIAKVGSTGYSTGPHIHFEVNVNGSAVNPWNYLQ